MATVQMVNVAVRCLTCGAWMEPKVDNGKHQLVHPAHPNCEHSRKKFHPLVVDLEEVNV